MITRTQQDSCTYELTETVTRHVQTQARPNSIMESGGRCRVPLLLKDMLTTDTFLERKIHFLPSYQQAVVSAGGTNVIPAEARHFKLAGDLALQIPLKYLFCIGAELTQQDKGTFALMLNVRL